MNMMFEWYPPANRCLTINKNGIYYGAKDPKCWECQPEPTKLDRVFVVTSIGANHVSLSEKVSS